MPGSPVDNPFQVTMPVGADDVIDRQEAISQICALAREGNNARVVGPRRYGKTSVVKQAQRELARSGEWETVYVDLLGITTLDELTVRIERSYVEALKGPVARWFDSLRRTLRPTIGVGGGAIPASGAVDLSGRTQSLVERLALPAQVHRKTGSRVHVVFDEFQEIDELDVAVDGILRSEIQHHAGEASYVFAGSAIRMMELMFTDRKSAPSMRRRSPSPSQWCRTPISPTMSTGGSRQQVRALRAPPSPPCWTWCAATPSGRWLPPTTSGTRPQSSPASSSGTRHTAGSCGTWTMR